MADDHDDYIRQQIAYEREEDLRKVAEINRQTENEALRRSFSIRAVEGQIARRENEEARRRQAGNVQRQPVVIQQRDAAEYAEQAVSYRKEAGSRLSAMLAAVTSVSCLNAEIKADWVQRMESLQKQEWLDQDIVERLCADIRQKNADFTEDTKDYQFPFAGEISIAPDLSATQWHPRTEPIISVEQKPVRLLAEETGEKTRERVLELVRAPRRGHGQPSGGDGLVSLKTMLDVLLDNSSMLSVAVTLQRSARRNEA